MTQANANMDEDREDVVDSLPAHTDGTHPRLARNAVAYRDADGRVLVLVNGGAIIITLDNVAKFDSAPFCG